MQGKFDEALGNAETAIAALGSSAAGQVRSADPERGPSPTPAHIFAYIQIYAYSKLKKIYKQGKTYSRNVRIEWI